MESRYILTKDLSTPYVVKTPFPHQPVAVRYKKFRAGQSVKGVLQMKDGKPAFILVNRTLVIPLSAVKELVTKDIVTSNADGLSTKKIEEKAKKGNPKIVYMDALIVGAIAGAAVIWLAQKRQWINPPDKKNYLYGIGIGAGLLAYLAFRIRNKTNK